MSEDNLKDNKENGGKNSRLLSSNSTTSLKNKEYSSIPSSRFYTAKEEVTFRFYQVPKSLFKNPVYKGLDLGPKLMYSVLRDRLDLSIKNNWQDSRKMKDSKKEQVPDATKCKCHQDGAAALKEKAAAGSERA